MINIAVAGGTGQLGLTLVEDLTKNPNHHIVVLSRKVRAALVSSSDWEW
jgi:uncharacterized protein YbjT (DUF2867 family)